MFFRVKVAPCIYDKCEGYTKDEGEFIIGIDCITCRYFGLRDNRRERNGNYGKTSEDKGKEKNVR